MDVFLVVGICAALFLVVERRSNARDEPVAEAAALEWSLFSQANVRRRLAALAEELDRLDHDPDVFAKAFHTKAARAAYEALLADVSRVGDRPRPQAGAVLEAEPRTSSRGFGEVLDL
jgi:hypothetical protein